jgi:hypothetical protein
MLLKEAAGALPKDIILHELLPRFNPFRLSDLQEVLSLREIFVDTDEGRVRLITDADLKECYFENAWGFREGDFVLAGWRKMSVAEMTEAVCDALPSDGTAPVINRWLIPPYKPRVETLKTKKDILRAYPELTYVPKGVYYGAIRAGYVMRLFPGEVDWEEGIEGADPALFDQYLGWACMAGLDKDLISGLAWYADERGPEKAARDAAMSGHTDVLDFLASELHAYIDIECMTGAAIYGLNSMIDHLVKTYELDPNESNEFEMTPLHYAAKHGHLRTVKHLIEKYSVDIHKRDVNGETALDWAEEDGRTECAAVLRGYGAVNGQPLDTNSDSSW